VYWVEPKLTEAQQVYRKKILAACPKLSLSEYRSEYCESPKEIWFVHFGDTILFDTLHKISKVCKSHDITILKKETIDRGSYLTVTIKLPKDDNSYKGEF